MSVCVSERESQILQIDIFETTFGFFQRNKFPNGHFDHPSFLVKQKCRENYMYTCSDSRNGFQLYSKHLRFQFF